MMVEVLLLVCAGFVSLIISMIFEDSISRWLAKLTSGRIFSKKRKIDGVWYSVYWRKTDDGGSKSHRHLVRFRSFGNRIYSSVAMGPSHHFRLSGKLSSDQYVTGEWDNDNPDVLYRGAFQFRLNNDGSTLTGKWIGWNRNGAINSGPWIMKKVTEKTDKESIEALALSINDGLRDSAFEINFEREFAKLSRQELENDTATSWFEIDQLYRSNKVIEVSSKTDSSEKTTK